MSLWKTSSRISSQEKKMGLQAPSRIWCQNLMKSRIKSSSASETSLKTNKRLKSFSIKPALNNRPRSPKQRLRFSKRKRKSYLSSSQWFRTQLIRPWILPCLTPPKDKRCKKPRLFNKATKEVIQRTRSLTRRTKMISSINLLLKRTKSLSSNCLLLTTNNSKMAMKWLLQVTTMRRWTTAVVTNKVITEAVEKNQMRFFLIDPENYIFIHNIYWLMQKQKLHFFI